MADRFWVGGGSSTAWAATGNTNWAATSGGANNQTVPGVGDVAIFDSNSGTGTSNIAANITVQGLDCTGGTGNYAGTITHATAVTLTINTGAASSLRLSSGMTYTPATTSSIVTLTHTSGTANITCAGKRLFALTVNGAGGTTKPLDALLVNFGTNAILTVTSGIFDANNFAVTACKVDYSGSTTRTVTMGSGAWTIGSNISSGQSVWNAQTTTLLTFNKDTANIVIANSATNPGVITFSSGGLTYNGLTINAVGTAKILNIMGNATFSSVTPAAGVSYGLPSGGTLTITTAPTFTGTPALPIEILCGSITGTATLSVGSGAVTLTWGGLAGITTGGGATFVATNTLNFGNNIGWTIAPPAAVPTVAEIAAAVWRDAVAADFTQANSIGLSVMNGVALGTGLTVNDVAQTVDANIVSVIGDPVIPTSSKTTNWGGT